MKEQNNNNEYPRLLILSHACLSTTDSNGRTLRNFLIGWPKEKIAQFCLQRNNPDFSVCNNFYCITDREALNAFKLKGTKDGRLDGDKYAEIIKRMKASPSQTHKKGIHRNPISMIVRNVVWSSGLWKGKYFNEWLEDFSPEVILIQAGDFAYMFKLARQLSKKYHAPIVLYNSEVYYFKNFDYFGSKGIKKSFYPLFRTMLRRQYRKCMKLVSNSIYACEMIEDEYKKEFKSPSKTIYTATEIVPNRSNENNDEFIVSYLGNLGVDRHIGLVAIAEALQNISKDLKLHVYGKIPNERVFSSFKACDGIVYHGFVSYEEVVSIMQKSDLLVHAEHFDDYCKKDLKYAFSTKIADSLASGTCFLLYAPEEMACSKYLIENSAAYVATDYSSLVDMLSKIYFSKEKRDKYIDTALALVKKNHTASENAQKFQNILINASKIQ